jgi:hypothetical protein
VIGIDRSPSCGVQTSLDRLAAVEVLRRCSLAHFERSTVTERVVGGRRTPGLEGSRDGSDFDLRVARHTLRGHALLAQRLGTVPAW